MHRLNLNYYFVVFHLIGTRFEMDLEYVLRCDQLMEDNENTEEEAAVVRLILKRMKPFQLSG